MLKYVIIIKEKGDYMIYQALYRKYRPKTFNDVYGQEIIVQTLKNMIISNKLTHAYLFVGPRGTGKTSIAKIFAKTINCENHEDGCSCEKCEICKASNSNENIDIIEMDAASNNGVDEIRDIRTHVTLLPTISKYKVYIVDEVHMLTASAFNALLKTLEEPPKHVIFILATTEPQKVPLTILSRCQMFEFKPVPSSKISENLKNICKKEKIKIDDDALEKVVEYSNGGMRDAIGLLDQASAYSNDEIKLNDVVLLNGRLNIKDVDSFFDLIYTNRTEDLFNFSDNLEIDGKNYISVCEDFIKYLRNNLIDYQINESNSVVKQFGKDNIIKMIFTITEYISQMKISNDKKIYFDLLIIKLLDIFDKKEDNVPRGTSNKVEKVEEKQESPKKENKKEEKEDEENNVPRGTLEDNPTYKLLDELMNARINNILMAADKESIEEYKKKLLSDTEQYNLDELRFKNILSDCEIKAGSPEGVVIVTSDDNIKYEMYDNFDAIEKCVKDKLGKKVKLCIYEEQLWISTSEIYRKKRKNKEKIDAIDEKEILNKLKSQNKSEFDDLLEIGE